MTPVLLLGMVTYFIELVSPNQMRLSSLPHPQLNRI